MNKGTNGCMYNCGDSCTGECMKPMNKEETIKVQQELINVLYSQVIDLSMMSKIELGDDVIAEIIRLKGLLNEQ